MEAVKVCQMAYRLGSMETFMRMVESGIQLQEIANLLDVDIRQLLTTTKDNNDL